MKCFAICVALLAATSLTAWSQSKLPGNAISSSKRYRESGISNATGRAGTATMTARALLGKDGNSQPNLIR